MSCVEAFPTELLLLIFAKVDVRDVLRCQVVSRKWNDIILQAINLQYRIELAKYGYEDDPGSSATASDLAELCRSEESWQRLGDSSGRQGRPQPVNIPLSSKAWDKFYDFKLFGHSLSAMPGPHIEGMLDIALINTEHQGSEIVVRRMDLREYGLGKIHSHLYDPDQNLLLVVGNRLVNGTEANLIVLHSFLLHWPEECHSDTRVELLHETTLVTLEFPFIHVETDLMISGEFVRARWRLLRPDTIKEEAGIIVWHWPSGEVLQRWINDTRTRYSDAFIASAAYIFVLRHDRSVTDPATLRSTLSIGVYSLPDDSRRDTDQCTLISTFELPPIAEKNVDLMFGEPISRHTILRLSQRLLSSAGVVVYFDIRCAIQQRFIESFSFFAPLATFIKHLSSSETSSNPPTFTWSTWGPNGARLCMKTRPDGLSLNNIADKPYVDGRTIYISGFRAVLNQGTEIMDFNPYHLSKVLSRKPFPPGAEIVKSPTHVHSRTFASRVTTTLPYMKMTLPAVERLLDDQRVSRHLEWYQYSRRLFFQDRNGLKMLCLNPERLDESEIMESAEIYSL